MQLRYIFFLIVFPFLWNCGYSPKMESAIGILSSEIISVESIPYSFGNNFIKTDKEGNKLHLSQYHTIWVIDMETGNVDFAVDLDTTKIVMPEESLHSFLVEEDSIFFLFPFSKKIVSTNFMFEQYKEINLTGIPHKFFINNYGDYFFKVDESWSLGFRYDANDYGSPSYLNDTRFIGLFESDGTLKQMFGEYSDERKKNPSKFNSMGSFVMDIKGDRIFFKNTAGTPEIQAFDLEGELVLSKRPESNLIDFSIPNSKTSGSLSINSPILNSTLDLKAIDENSIATLTFIVRKEIEYPTDKQVLMIYSISEDMIYTLEVEPYQRLIKATPTHLYFFRNHPKIDELIIVKVAYELKP